MKVGRKKFKFLFIIGLFFYFHCSGVFAGSQPKFTIEPLTPTTLAITNIATPTVKYVVTNKTKHTRTLTMVQIPGVTQRTDGAGYCETAFTLGFNQSCILSLEVIGTQVNSSIHTGPEICKTQSAQNQAPDPFLCSQPSLINTLNVTITPTAKLSVSPKLLTLQVGGSSAVIRVTNNSSTVTARNISAQLSNTPLAQNVIQDASNCTSLAPGASCDLTFTPGPSANSTSSIPFAIIGTNALPVGAAIKIFEVGDAIITVSGSPLILQGTTQGSLTITNATANPATFISATLTGTLASNVTQNSSDCDSLSANSTCTLYFTSNNGLPIEPGAYLITGTNSSTNRAVIAVDGDDYSISITSGSPLSLTVNGNAGSMVVRNDSSNTLYNINANFSGTALEGKVSQTGSTCPEGLAPGSDCTLSFTPGSQNVSQTSFPITGVSSDGASSATVNGQISINYINYYVYAMGSSYSIFRCKIDATTGLITSPSSCVPAGADGTFDAIYERVVFTVDQDANKFYAVIKGEGVEICTVNVDNGYLYTCSLYTNTGLSISVPSGVAVNYNPTYGQKYLYYVDENSDAIQGCSISSTNGTLSNCQSFISTTNPIQIAVNSAGTYAYVTTSSSVSFR